MSMRDAASRVTPTQAQRFAVKFMWQLEYLEDIMGEGPALPHMLQRFGLDPADTDLVEDLAYALPAMPSGAWWVLVSDAERDSPPTQEESEAWKAL